MSGAPPPQQPTCNECGEQKTTREKTITQRDKTEQEKKKGHHGNVSGGGYGGDYNSENTTLNGQETEDVSKAVFNVCPTPGCAQRGKDRWKVRQWQLENNPKLDNSYESQEHEKQRIKEKEAKLAEDMNDFSENSQIKNNDRNSKKRESYGTSKNNIETYSSHQSVRDSTNQSDTQSHRSREWGDTPDNNDTAWSEAQAAANGWGTTTENDSTGWGKDTNAKDQGAAATAGNDTSWGNPRESDTDAREQDSTKSTRSSTIGTANSSTDTGDQTETTSGSNAFEQSVYGDTQTDSQGSTLANESPKAEDSDKTNPKSQTEHNTNRRSRNRSR